VEFQPDVYQNAGRIAEALGLKRIIDVGCGRGRKLAPMATRFDVMGIDFGANLEQARKDHPNLRWIEHDLLESGPLPLDEADLTDSLLVCGDVIEHLPDPEPLIEKLRLALQTARVVMISTPERDSSWGAGHQGPPPNTAHVQEWSIREFAAHMRRRGFAHGSIGLTRTHEQTWRPQTLLGTYAATQEDLERVDEVLIDHPPVPDSVRARVGGGPQAVTVGAALRVRRALMRARAPRAAR
jgi:2-polyprenyl-3-methyl-5-hydroxy-6-metoxy-1,4-benzoquinol methylase